MVLAVQNVQGPIIIKNCSFSKLVTYTTHEFNKLLSSLPTYNCAKEKYFSTFTASNIQIDKTTSSILDVPNDISATASYKIYLDKHIRKFLYRKREIGSALHIKNVTYGLILYNNSFD